MATVYLAEDLKHHRQVAIKVLRPELASALGPDRFLREIEIVARLHHPNILSLDDSGEADGLLYYVMPYVEGESLRDRLEREEQLPLDEAMRVAEEVAEALSYAHSHGVVHRDIKPENILLESGHALVTDFGVAHAVGEREADRLTDTGLALGTPAYMSPEQAAGNATIDGRSDVYSLATVLYEMLAGEPPHTGPTPQAILARQLTGEVRSLIPLRSTVKPAVDANIKRALARAPADRYTTPTQFIEALRADRPVMPGKIRWRRRVRHVLALTAGVAVTVLVVMGIRSLFTQGTAEAGERPVTMTVFPFRGTGPESGTLGEGVADLLAAALDGTVGMSVADPSTLWRSLRRSAGDVITPPDVDRAVELTQRVSARSMVLGTVMGVGGRLEIAARVYDGNGILTTSLTASAPLDSLPQAVDRLAVAIVAEVWDRDTLPTVPVIEELATESIEALQAYLYAMTLKRIGRFEEALEEIHRAADLDSTFALAHMEWFTIRSIVLYMNAEPFIGLTEIVDRAMRHRDRLSLRNRLRVEAMKALDETNGVRATSLLEQIIAIDSADTDAVQSVAFTSLRDGWQMGRRMEDIVAAYDRAVAVDSAALLALASQAFLALQTDDAEKAAWAVGRIAAQDTTTAYARGFLGAVEALQASPDDRSAVLRRLAGMPVPVLTTALRHLRVLRPQLAERFLDELLIDTMPLMQQRVGIGARTQLWMAQGRVAASDSLVRLGDLDAIRSTVNRFFVTSLLTGVGDSAAAARAVDELAAFAPADSLEAYLNTKPAVWATGWAVAAYEATLGDSGEARTWQQALAALPTGGTSWDWTGALVADVEARLAVRRGDPVSAEREARRAFDLWSLHSNNVGEGDPEPAMRFHLAEILRAAGAVDSAAALYRSLAPPHGWIGFYSARAAFESGEIARAQGESAEAARYYRLAERLWELGEPHVVGPWLERTRAGQRLVGGR
jgi:serine/threonine-protein kinase